MTSKLECPFCGHMWDRGDLHPTSSCHLSRFAFTEDEWRRRPDPLLRTYTGSTPVPQVPLSPKIGEISFLPMPSLRSEIASRALAALITDPNWREMDASATAKEAVEYADALIDALEEKP